ncbi:MAG: Serine/threonine-protein kinase PrkC [Gammaproteobacteria bacterium]|nr:Serine/threonine-protein kinase PrkC [Gammaproteobacteria bacterium]
MAREKKQKHKIERIRLKPGTLLAGRYEILERLGGGWEGEVYLVREKQVNIERTAKLFFPHRNVSDRTRRFYAKKLHKLRRCPIIIQYHTQETLDYKGVPVKFLVSEYVPGERLTQFIRRQPGNRLHPFQALHLLHALAEGIECIHRYREYHGDLHADNIVLQRHGLHFEPKVIDMFHWGSPNAENLQSDVIDLVHVFYEAVGGKKHYARQPQVVKNICCGLKKSFILKKFRNVRKLRQHLEELSW